MRSGTTTQGDAVVGLLFFAVACADFFVVLVLLVVARAYARRRFHQERRAFAAQDAKTWHAVKPAMLGVPVGSVEYIAGVVQAEAPVGLTYTFRARENQQLNTGTVRVSIEAGARQLKEES